MSPQRKRGAVLRRQSCGPCHSRNPEWLARRLSIRRCGELGGEADLAAKLVAHRCLAFAEAAHLRLVHGVDLVRGIRRPPQRAGDEGHAFFDPGPQPAFEDGVELVGNVAQVTSRLAP